MARSVLAIIAIAGVVAAAAAMPASTYVVSSGSMVAAQTIGWESQGAADASEVVRATIALKRNNDGKLTRIAAEVSDPNSPRYGRYPAMKDLVRMSRPSKPALSAVRAWLAEAGIEATASPTGVFSIETTVGVATELFNTNFHRMSNSVTGQSRIAGEAVMVPADLAAHVEAVFGVHDLPLPPRSMLKTKSANVASVTPAVIASTYNISGVTPSGSQKNRQAVVEFQGQLLSQSDLSKFFSTYVPTAKAGQDKVYKYVGDSTQGQGVEANLDIQYIMGVAPGILTEAWQYDGQAFCSDLKQWTQQVISTTNPPNVFSVSYGWQGDMSQIGCSASQISSIDADFKTITATGVSIIFASGDSGSGYSSFFGYNPTLYSSWPASSQYVTSVGATRFINQQPGAGEQASDQFGSGGGFSKIITPAPAFQASAIKTFYSEETNAPANKSTYGFGGRGTPDVAALGEGFEVFVGGNAEPVGGTSAAAPTFAAVVSLLNEARISAGKAPLGNLNAWIYQEGNAIFNDVTVGNDRISRSGSTVPLGFDCEAGWDPVTGYGTPLFLKMKKSAMKN